MLCVIINLVASFKFWSFSLAQLPLLRRWAKENFLVLEILPQGVCVFLLNLDNDKRLSLEKFWQGIDLSKLPKTLRSGSLKRKLIVSADSSLAYTAILPISFKRDFPSEPLSSVELENSLFGVIGKVFNQYREEASRALGVDELDVILIDSQVSNFKIDGHKIVSPLGFKSRMVDAVLQLTLTTRKVFDDIRMIFGQNKDFFFTEMGRSQLLSLEKLGSPPFGFAVFDPRKSSYFFLDYYASGSKFIRRGEFEWRPEFLLQAISENWGLDEDISSLVYNVYLRGEVSDRVKRALKGFFQPQIELFWRNFNKTRLRGRVYFTSHIVFPFSLPQRKQKFIFDEPPLLPLLEKLGLALNFSEWPADKGKIFRYLAPFFEFYYNSTDTAINDRLKRRLRWLGVT